MGDQQRKAVNGGEENNSDDIDRLELMSTIGFNGSSQGSLSVHPDRNHIVYPLGNTVIVENLNSKKQDFLQGHTNTVTCVTISRSGRFIASGQQTHMGFKAMIIVWDYEKRSVHCKLDLHKVKVQDLAFSPNDLYLVSLGGQDDGAIVIWDVMKKEAVCGSEAAVKSAGTTYCVAAANQSDFLFFSGGERTLRVWDLDVENRKIRPTDVSLGQLKRIVKSIVVAPEDDYFYCATTTGDILRIIASTKMLSCYGPKKDLFGMGVTSLVLVKDGTFLLGTGDGTVAHAKFIDDKFKVIKKKKIDKAGHITSLTLRGQGHQFFVGTSNSHIYRFNFSEFTYEMIRTCHYEEVNDIAFPKGCSELFVTSSKNDIRVWETASCKELMRINVPNMECHAVCIMPDGKSIVSAWNDNKIRSFLPQSGKLLYEIADAHNKAVTALAVTSNNKRIISGGGEGQVRVWDIFPREQKLRQTLKEHKGVVAFVRVNHSDTECVSASTDGTCIIWDLHKFVRSQVVFANTLFRCVCYSAEQSQIITCGTDRKIAYWQAGDSSQIREVEGSKGGAINAMDMSSDGSNFVTGGDDALIKVWDYVNGVVTSIGVGHCSEIKRLRICPHQKYIISVSKDGAIFRWKYPSNCSL
ncbi:cilia- and flagella-associated protein 52 [Strongylocentrotus purpuratus]|uniref:Cilia- and flagella-associated protein 52 n=1 Tax=Strongylocentrotus purpuratus TaxID=7668 RepID=A0A7M7NV05_STRPU|nr:cilia- and flagella-associated protein 52 [Strongylocentrotus purpuratus]XP_787783.1 cilia- and flagella-associated protein 52 [Strongylocentrotus purpuratus]8SNB_4A Chain 4A, Cilia- and flagella-associated protein 52 [Strongylocentrotus purpuratus]8SNB_4B Chain 4B, Cilia- and flagella-associated protein 52 [Strongylocentrotus purpuratus]8SNB_4C Chain 4C, Cilia- and flagella-associated protein 52 [Strongylocentrotus purpuratus]|eukprot:XP_787783.1 PREDICTED: cilia- and flagella-associated protein 52 [Strongylocentrotus purpuratus]